jgi:hypothetical protein
MLAHARLGGVMPVIFPDWTQEELQERARNALDYPCDSTLTRIDLARATVVCEGLVHTLLYSEECEKDLNDRVDTLYFLTHMIQVRSFVESRAVDKKEE